jgi:hypothetical protein
MFVDVCQAFFENWQVTDYKHHDHSIDDQGRQADMVRIIWLIGMPLIRSKLALISLIVIVGWVATYISMPSPVVCTPIW